MKKIIGVDIGGTKCAVLFAEVGVGISIKDKRSFLTETENGFAFARDNIFKAIESLLKSNALEPYNIDAIGVSCGGPLDSASGVIYSPPNLPGWDGIPLAQMLYDRFGIPAYIQNDANACALAEWKLGAGKGCNDVIFLTMGTGMGAGIISGGRLIEGANGMAGEAGHIRLAADGPEGYGKRGSFEGFCAGSGIAGYAKEVTRRHMEAGETPAWINDGHDAGDITAKLIAEYAEKGDATAVDIFKNVGEKLGEALSVLIDILNPERIVIGSIFARSSHLLMDSMNKSLKREALSRSLEALEIVPAQTGESVGDYAGIMAACYALGIDAEETDHETDAETLAIYERLFKRYPKLSPIRENIMSAYLLLRDVYAHGGKLLLCGNGGSAADCGHITGELMKGFYKKRPLDNAYGNNIVRELNAYGYDMPVADLLQGSLMAIDLTQHNALSTAFANDVSPALVFAQQVHGFGVKGDVLLAISTSGNAQNCAIAAITAKAKGMGVIALTGPGGGELAHIADHAIKTPGESTADVQEYHLPIYHTLCAMLEEKFF